MYEIYIGLGPLIQNMYLEVSSCLPYVRAGALGSENHELGRPERRFWKGFLASGVHGALSQRRIRLSPDRYSTYRSTFFHATVLKKFEGPQKGNKHELEISQNRGQN